MRHFEVRQSEKLNLTSYPGLALIGQCCQASQVDLVIDPRFPVSQGMHYMEPDSIQYGIPSANGHTSLLIARAFAPQFRSGESSTQISDAHH